MYESPKWLLATGRLDQCRAALRGIMRVNKVQSLYQNIKKRLKFIETPCTPPQVEREVVIPDISGSGEAGQQVTFLDLFRTPMILRNTVIIRSANIF